MASLHNVDVYYSFRSPFSYLASGRLAQLPDIYADCTVTLRPVYPAAIRNHQFISTMNPMWPRYSLMVDAPRLAERYGVKWKGVEFNGAKVFFPSPDPIKSDPKTRLGVALEDQPYIQRLTRLGVAAEEQEPGVGGMVFANKLHEVMYTVTDWHKGDTLKRGLAASGIDLDALDAMVKANPATYDAAIKANEAAQKKAGHWGVPLMVYDGEAFFGQDRIDLLTWRMERKGCVRRVPAAPSSTILRAKL